MIRKYLVVIKFGCVSKNTKMQEQIFSNTFLGKIKIFPKSNDKKYIDSILNFSHLYYIVQIEPNVSQQ